MAGEPVGPATDVYALGLLLLEAITGTREYDGPAVEAAMARLHRDPALPADAAGRLVVAAHRDDRRASPATGRPRREVAGVLAAAVRG